MDWLRNIFYRLSTTVVVVMSLLIVSAYERDFHETGDSELSYLRTDFIETRTNEPSVFTSATIGDGTQPTLKPTVEEQRAKKPGTTYRILLYYNKVENGMTSSFVISPVAVLHPRSALDLPTVYIDPVGFENVWISKNHKYLNLTLSLETGRAEDEKAVQTLTIVYDSVKNLPSGGQVFRLRLHHHRNRVPEYCSRRVFTSTPLNGLKQQDSICLNINTYKGEINKQTTF